MSFGFNQIKWDSLQKIATKEVVVKTSVGDAESGGASKVLNVEAGGKLMSLDAAGDTARVFGRVNFKLLYIDNQGEIRGLDYFADFNESIQIEGLSGKIYARIAVIDVDTSLNGGIKLTAAVELSLYSVTEKDIKCLSEADEEYYVEKGVMKCQKFVTSFVSPFSVSDEFDTKTDVQKVALFESKAYITDVNAGMGNVLVSGSVTACVTYIADDAVKTAEFSVPYSEEFGDSMLNIGQSLSADAAVKSSRVVLTGIEGSNVIKIEAEIEITVKAYETVEEEIVGDIFSVTHELLEKRESAGGSIFKGFRSFCDGISGTAVLDGAMPPALEVIGTLSCRNSVAQAVADGDKIIIEGVFSGTVLYRDENGLSSVELEVPYSLPFAYEGIGKEDTVSAAGAVIRASAKLKRDREIEVTAELCFMTEVMSPAECEYISEISVGEEKDINKSAVSVYIAEEGETIWDAAKALSARPDDIRAQNPELNTPLKEGDRIFFYRQINFEF